MPELGTDVWFAVLHAALVRWTFSVNQAYLFDAFCPAPEAHVFRRSFPYAVNNTEPFLQLLGTMPGGLHRVMPCMPPLIM